MAIVYECELTTFIATAAVDDETFAVGMLLDVVGVVAFAAIGVDAVTNVDALAIVEVAVSAAAAVVVVVMDSLMVVDVDDKLAGVETFAAGATDKKVAALNCVLGLVTQKKEAVATHFHASDQQMHYCRALYFLPVSLCQIKQHDVHLNCVVLHSVDWYCYDFQI